MTTHLAPPDRGRRRLPAHCLLGLVLLALVAVVVTACSAGASSDPGVVSLTDPSASPDPSTSPTASQDPEEAMLAFQQCMRDHGVDVQVATAVDGNGGTGGKIDVHVGDGPSKGTAGQAQPGKGLDVDKVQAADTACRHLLPDGGMGDPSRTMDPQLQDQMLQFAQCMRDHGIDFPDPQFDGGRVTIGLGGATGKDGATLPDPDSATFKAAQEACGSNLPGGAPFTVSGKADAGSQP